MNIINVIKTELSNIPKYWEDEVLIVDKVTQDLLVNDEELLAILLANELIKNKFSKDIKGTVIFQKDELISVLKYKEFLGNSFTKYENEIGLTSENKFLKYNTDVVLNFPYKDCVLEGGMTKEDCSREEIFYNKTIASEEIDMLFEDKAFRNIRKIDKTGYQEVNQYNDENLVIKGNNLIALHSLKSRFVNKIKLIYIDPPYNTKEDSFKYNDRFNHSSWLTFMKNRIEVAYELLMDKGLLFMHIGDQEMHYLKVLCDSILGRSNFVATVPRKTRSGKSDVPYKLSQDYDWILIYVKNAQQTDKLFQREIERKYYKSDDFPNDEWRLSDLTKQTSIKERPKSNFTLINPRNGAEYPVNPNRSWSITVDTVDYYLGKGKIVFPGDYPFLNISQPAMRIFKSEEIAKNGEDFNKTYVSTEFLNNAMDTLLKKATNKKGTDDITGLFVEKVFSFPKNEILLYEIIRYCTNEGDWILDFFAGSGTTAAVAHKTNRKYITIEQMEYIEEVTVKRLEKVVEGEQGGISEEVNWQGGGEFIYTEMAEFGSVYVNKLLSSQTKNEIISIWNELVENNLLKYKVALSSDAIIKRLEEIEHVDDLRKIIIELLDYNQLYIPYSEVEDRTYKFTNDEIQFNTSFYEENEENQ